MAYEQAELEQDKAAQEAALTFAIVGAGATGVEIAGAIAGIADSVREDFRSIDTRATRIILIDFADRVLTSFHPELSERAKQDLERLGVEVLLQTRVTDVDEKGKPVISKWEATSVDELKKKHPQAYKLYDKYTKRQPIIRNIRIQPQRIQIRPGRGFRRLVDPTKAAQELEQARQELQKATKKLKDLSLDGETAQQLEASVKQLEEASKQLEKALSRLK